MKSFLNRLTIGSENIGRALRENVLVALATSLCLATMAFWLTAAHSSLAGSFLIVGWVATISLLLVGASALRYVGTPTGPRWLPTASLLFLAVIGMTFTFAQTYAYIDVSHRVIANGSCSPVEFSECLDRESALYFTLSTLSTVGYGDVAPKGRRAREVAMMQMAVGLAIVSIGVGRLISVGPSQKVERSRPRIS